VRAYVGERHPTLAVTVVANNRPVGRWELLGREPEERVVQVPADVVAQSPVLHLRFVIDTPVSPASLGISADDRMLGIGMEAMRISRAAGS